MPEAPKYKKSEIRYQRILEAALELFLAKGYEATGLSDIIAKAAARYRRCISISITKRRFF